MAVWSETNIIETMRNKRIDSEFFHPQYIAFESVVEKIQNARLGMLGQFVIGPFGSAFHVNNYDSNSPFRYIRGKDVKPFRLLEDDNVYMPEKDYFRLHKYAICQDDLIISVVGTLGNVAIIPEDEKGIFSCKSTLFRNPKIDAHYLLAYLNSKYGNSCLLRRQRGAVQTGLNKEDLKTVPVALASQKKQEMISSLVKNALKCSKTSKSLYTEAQKLLELEFGLDKVKVKKTTGYIGSFSKVVLSSRTDAEFFYPEFDILSSNLPKHINFSSLSKALSFCQRGKQPVYSDAGLTVINSKNVLANKINIENTRFAQPPIFPELKIQYGDVLINGTGRGTIGRAAPYLENAEALPDNHVTILRTPGIDPVFLSVFLNSKAGQLQVEKHQRGSSGQIEPYPFDIRKFLIWEAPQKLQFEIRDLYDRALSMEKESKDLLEKAKQAVEQLIEQAAEKT